MDELTIIAEKLRTLAEEFLKEPGYTTRETHLKVEVAQCILRAHELGKLVEIESLEVTVATYKTRNEEIEETARRAWTGADNPLLEFFDRVIGYSETDLEVGIIKTAARFLPPSVCKFTYAEDAARHWSDSCKFLAVLCSSPPDDPVLTTNHRDLLQAMWELQAIRTSPRSGEEIAKKAGSVSEVNHGFEALKKAGLVDAKRSVGRYLTEKGISLAKRLFGEQK